MWKFLSVLLVILTFNSCAISGLTSDYGKLNSEEKKIIHKHIDSFDNLNSNEIYTINAQQLKQELRNNEKSLVYVFANGCVSAYCLPMNVYENYAKKHSMKLYLVMNGFGNLESTLEQNFSSPLFAIDYEYYETKFRFVATRKFENELRNRPLGFKEKEYEGSLFFFEKDRLIKVVKELK